ncbi:hypothetical protein [Micromonospora rubida]
MTSMYDEVSESYLLTLDCRLVDRHDAGPGGIDLRCRYCTTEGCAERDRAAKVVTAWRQARADWLAQRR